MGDTWITDMTHYLDDLGRIPDLPAPAMRLALYFGSQWQYASLIATRLAGVALIGFGAKLAMNNR